MTVEELLKRIVHAYPGATPEAMKAFQPSFNARLKRGEGVALEQASIEVFASFRATPRQPFPIAADFEAHLPGPKRAASESKLDVAGYRARKASLIDEWRRRQGNGIARLRGVVIAGSCEWIVRGIAERAAWKPDPAPILLSEEQIQIGEDRVVSSERNAVHGTRSLYRPEDGGEQWRSETATCRAMIREGRSPVEELTPARVPGWKRWLPANRRALEKQAAQ